MYFYKEALNNIFHVGDDILPAGRYILRIHQNGIVVGIESADTHEWTMGPHYITKLQKEDGSYYTDLAELLVAVKDFFKGGYAGDVTSLDGRVTHLEDLQLKILYYAEIDGTTTSGTISIPTGATILFDQWENEVDAVLSNIPVDKPDYQNTGIDVTSLDSNGNYTLSGTLATDPAAFIYYILVPLIDYDNLDPDHIIDQSLIVSGSVIDKMEWQGLWTQQTYSKNDVVKDGDWTMVANKETSDTAAPQAVGVANFLYQGTGPELSTVSARQLVVGMSYTSTLAFWLSGYRIHTVAGNHYEIISVLDPDGVGEVKFLNRFVATTSGWRDFGLMPRPITAGVKFDLYAIIYEPDPTPTTWDADYNYQKPNNSAVPTTGQIVHANKLDNVLRIHKTDADTVPTDRSAALLALQAGDIITVGLSSWAIQGVTDDGTYVSVDIAPAIQAAVSGVQNFTFEITAADTLSYARELNYWLGNANVRGLYVADDSWENAVANDNQYGVDVYVQEAYISPDWDLVAYSGTGGFSPTTSGLDNVITVAKSGGDFSDVAEAINSITDSSSTNRYTIQVAPGVYEVNNDAGAVALKDFISIEAVGGRGVIFSPTTTTNDMFTGAHFCYLVGIVFSGNTGTAYIVKHESAGIITINNCVLRDCANGFFINHASAQMGINQLVINNPLTTTTVNALRIEAGSLDVDGIVCRRTSVITTIVYAINAGTLVNIHNFLAISTQVATAIYATDGAIIIGNVITIAYAIDGLVVSGNNTQVSFDACKILNCQNDGFRVDNTGTGIKVNLFSTSITDCTGLNFNILNSNSLTIGNGFSQMNKSYKAPGADLYAYILDTTIDDEGLNILGELHVGTPANPAESVLGEGDSYTNGMIVYTFDGTNYVDISDEARSGSGSTFTFPNTNENTAIYMASIIHDGSDYVTHHGIKSKLTVAGVWNTGDVVVEYWDGAAWQPVALMESESGGDYLPHASAVFEHAGSHQIRYDSALATTFTWTKNDPITPAIGTDYYWIRYRIDAALGITTSPTFEQFKLHSNRFEINGDGWPEYFGKARPIGRLPWDVGFFEKTATTDPKDQDFYLTKTIDVGSKKNKFQYASAKSQRIGFKTTLPLDLDTSSPIVFEWAVVSNSNSAGDDNWILRWGYSSDGSALFLSDGDAPVSIPNEQEVDLILPAPDAEDKLKWYSVNIDVSNMISRRENGYGDTLWFSIERVRGYDHLGDISMVDLSANYIRWCEGGHM